ncbi:hypothetical protein [Enterococcus sp. LJL90]
MSLLVDAVCPKCGYVNLELLDYCPNCGFQLRGTSGTNHPNAGISDEEIPENIINREEPIASSSQVIFAFPAGFGEKLAETETVEAVSNADLIQESVILPWKKEELAKENNNSSSAVAIEEMASLTDVDSSVLTEDFFEEDTMAASDDDGLTEEQIEATTEVDADLLASDSETAVETPEPEPETDEASAFELVNITTESDNSDEETQVEAAEDLAEMAIVADDVEEDDESAEANESLIIEEIPEEVSEEAVTSTEEAVADSSEEKVTDDTTELVEVSEDLSNTLSGEAVVAEPEITAGTISRILEELAVIEALLQAEKEKLASTQQASSSENTSLIANESTTQQPAATKIEAMVEEYVVNESADTKERALSSDEEEDWIEEIEAASGGVHLAIVNNLLLNVMLMFVIAAGILALQYFILSHFTSELLLLSQQWGYLDVTWMLSISNGILLIILIVLVVPLVIALTSGIKDLIKFFKFSR